MLIEDGQGSGNAVGVNAEHRIKTIAVSSTPEHQANHEYGLAYNLLFQETPTLSDPSNTTTPICFLYLKNLNDLDLIIEGIDLRIGGTNQSEIIEVAANDGETPIGGNTRTPVNLNLGSANVANVTSLSSSEITELTFGTTLMRYYCASSNTTTPYNFEQDLIIPKNNVITLWATNGDIEIDGTLIFHFSNKDF